MAGFAHWCPAWVDLNGQPRSWFHYLVGRADMFHAQALEELRVFRAVSAAFAEDVDRKHYQKERQAVAGLLGE